MSRSPARGPSKPSDKGVAAVDRAVAILAAFSREGSMSLAELANRTGIYKSTILRLAESLIGGHLLMRLDDGTFKIGPEALRLGALYQQSFNLSEILLPKMRALSAETGESIVFYVRDGANRVCVFRVESHQPIRFHIREGDVIPLPAGSGGQVILAFSGERGKTYAATRKRFYYTSLGERSADTAGIAAPVLNSRGELAGIIGVSGPLSRIDAIAAQNMVPMLLRTARLATFELGGDATAFDLPLKNAEDAAETPQARPASRTSRRKNGVIRR